MLVENPFRERKPVPIDQATLREVAIFDGRLGADYIEWTMRDTLVENAVPKPSEEQQKTLEARIGDVAKFIRDEIFSHMLQLKLINQINRVDFALLNQPGASLVETVTGELFIVIPSSLAEILLFKDVSDVIKADIKSRLVYSFSHESYHIYTAEMYPRTFSRSAEANERKIAGDKKATFKDRGEIAAELYAIKALVHKATEVKGSDVIFSKSLNDLAQERIEYMRVRLKGDFEAYQILQELDLILGRMGGKPSS